MSVISGMDEVIAFIDRQVEKIKTLQTNEKVREELIVDMKAEIVELKKGISKEEVEKTAKVIYNLLNGSKKLQEENDEKDQEIHRLEEELDRFPENSAGYTQEEFEEMVNVMEDITEHPDYDNLEIEEDLVKKDEEISQLKNQLKFEQEQGTIVVHQNQALLAENSEVKKENEEMIAVHNKFKELLHKETSLDDMFIDELMDKANGE